MTYSTNYAILASDFNTIAGGQTLATPFASAAAAQKTCSGLLGVGYGDRGYGQLSPEVPINAAGEAVTAADWLAIRSAVAKLASHQGQSTVLLPPAAHFVAGQPIQAENDKGTLAYDDVLQSYNSSTVTYDSVSAIAYNIPYLLNALDAGRFNTHSGASMTLTPNVLSMVRNGTWGGGAVGISATATATFASEDQARFFFNSGGEIRLAFSHPAGTSQDNNWNAALAALGTVSFKANATTRSGTVGTQYSKGYYQLTTADQTICAGVIGTSAYSANSIVISARASAITGENGAKGAQIVFTITLDDNHTSSFSDICLGGTSVTFSHLKATAALTGIVAPTIAAGSAWA